MSGPSGVNLQNCSDFLDDEYLPNLPRPSMFQARLLEEPCGTAKYSPSVKVIHVGHSRLDEKTKDMLANCTVTLIRGRKFNILVDTMTSWDGKKLESLLDSEGMSPSDINYVVCTHGHSDHIGCNYLFQQAHHIVGNSMSLKERYFSSPLDDGGEFRIEPKVKVVCTPGHTADSVSVLVETAGDLGLVAITGDLFEREADIENPALWRETAGSQDPVTQEKNRNMILRTADWIVPGHGPMFKNIYKEGLAV